MIPSSKAKLGVQSRGNRGAKSWGNSLSGVHDDDCYLLLSEDMYAMPRVLLCPSRTSQSHLVLLRNTCNLQPHFFPQLNIPRSRRACSTASTTDISIASQRKTHPNHPIDGSATCRNPNKHQMVHLLQKCPSLPAPQNSTRHTIPGATPSPSCSLA